MKNLFKVKYILSVVFAAISVIAAFSAFSQLSFAETDLPAKLNGNYYTLSEALNIATENSVVEFFGGEITENLTVKKGVTLVIPYTESSLEEDIYCGQNTVTIAEGFSLTVYGNLILEGKYYEGVFNKNSEKQAYSRIFCNGSIKVYGKMSVCGAVFGSGKIYAYDGCEITAPFVIGDYTSEENADALYNDGVFPFSVYNLYGINCNLSFDYGAKLNGAIYYGEGLSESFVTLIDKNNAALNMKPYSHAEFNITSKSIEQTIANRYMGNFFCNNVTITGEVSVGNFEIAIKNKIYSTEKTNIPIPYLYNTVLDGGMMDIPENVTLKFLPGAELTVLGGTLNVYGGIHFYSGLITYPKGGVNYPQAEILYGYGFKKVASFINNGTVNVYGEFTGIVQSTCSDSVINIAATAVLYKTLREGSLNGSEANFTSVCNKAMAFSADKLTDLKCGITYKSWAISPLTLDFCAMDRAVYSEGDSIKEALPQDLMLALYQTYYGCFAECYGENYRTQITFYIGENIDGVTVILNGERYVTENGRITAEVTFDSTRTISYYTEETCINQYTAIINDCGQTLLDKVFKNVSLCENNDYTLKSDIENSFYALIEYYAGNSEKVQVYPVINESKRYVEDTCFINTNYNFSDSLAHTVYFYKAEFDSYKNGVNGLIGSLSLINDAKNLYNSYQKLVYGRNEKEVEYLNNLLRDFKEYFDIVTDFSASVVYGDTKVLGAAKTLSGKTDIVIEISGYNFSGGLICADCKFSGDYKGVGYSIEKQIVATPRPLTYIIDNIESVYGEAPLPLTGKFIDADPDIYEDVVSLYCDVNAFSPAGYYAISGRCLSPYYNITFANAAYTVLKKPLTITVYDKTLNIVAGCGVTMNYDLSCPIIDGAEVAFEVFADSVKVADIIKGKLTPSLAVGTYIVKPLIHSSNYTVAYVSGILNITAEPENYTVGFGFTSGGQKEYDGSAFDFTPVAKDSYGNALPNEYITTVIYRNGDIVESILHVGVYEIVVTVCGEPHYASFTVVPANVKVTVHSKTIVYGELDTNFEYTADAFLPDGVITFKVLPSGKIVATSSDNDYCIDCIAGGYTVLPRPITVTAYSVKTIYGDDADITYSLTGGSLAYSDCLNSVIGIFRESGKDVGVYDIGCKVLDDRYNVTFISAVYEICPREISVAALNEAYVYGEKIAPKAIVTFGSLCYEDKIGDILYLSVCGTHVGSYAVLCELKTENYKVDFTSANVVIKKRPVLVEIFDSHAIYGEDLKVEYKVTNLPDDEDITSLVEFYTDGGNIPDVGVYGLHVKVKNNPDYAVTVIYSGADGCTFTVEKQQITIRACDVVAEFTESFESLLQKCGYILESGTIHGEENIKFALFVDGAIFDGDYEDFIRPGEYQILCVFDNDNYSVTSVAGKFIATKTQITLVPPQTPYVYTGYPIVVFDKSENADYPSKIDNLIADGDFLISLSYYDGEDFVDCETVTSAGRYRVTVYLSDNSVVTFKNGYSFYEVTVKKADISADLKVNLPEDEYCIVGSAPTLSAAGYDVLYSVRYYLNGTPCEGIFTEGLYKAVFTVEDSNYCGSIEKTFYAYNNVEEKIESIKTLLNDYDTLGVISREAALKSVKEIIENFTEGDLVQIDKKSAYRSVIEDFESKYRLFYTVDNKEKVMYNPLILVIGGVIFAAAVIYGIIQLVIMKKSAK